MKITPNEDVPYCLACDTRLNIPGLQRCNSCGMECYLDSSETDHASQKKRLLLSWGVVLQETWAVEPESGCW